MSILYCTIPHFAAALARRDDPGLAGRPLVLIGPDERVLGRSAEAAACGVVAGLTARAAQIRCPDARLLEADLARCRDGFESLLALLEGVSPTVEPHGWGALYADLSGLAPDHDAAVALCREIGRAVRRELGRPLQPALGWDSSKFTAQAAARRTRPGHLRAVEEVRARDFLRPLPVTLLPLAPEVLQRLGFLGLRTLGQYAALPASAVGQQFGRAGRLAQRYAQGEDDRPVIPRWQAPQVAVACELAAPLADRELLLAQLHRAVAPALAALRGNLQACGQVRLMVDFDDGHTQERSRTFLSPTADEGLVLRTLGQLLDGMDWKAPAVALAVTLGQLQEAVVEQLTLFGSEDARERKLQEVQRYLAARFGAARLRRAILSQPGAPLPEWRVGEREVGAPSHGEAAP